MKLMNRFKVLEEQCDGVIGNGVGWGVGRGKVIYPYFLVKVTVYVSVNFESNVFAVRITDETAGRDYPSW